MGSFVLLVMLFAKGDNHLDYLAGKTFDDKASCEAQKKDLPPAPDGFKLVTKCIAMKDLNTTEAGFGIDL